MQMTGKKTKTATPFSKVVHNHDQLIASLNYIMFIAYATTQLVKSPI